MKPPWNDGKFMAYGGPNLDIDAELRGRVAAVESLPENQILYVVPDRNYHHLLIEGNVRQPSVGSGGYDWYLQNIMNAGFGGQPVIKCETYGVGHRPDSAPLNAGLPTVLESGSRRPVRIGDHISLQGLWAIDYSHPMYHLYPTSDFNHTSFPVEISFGHSEIHPYRFDSLRLVGEMSDQERATERHLLGAPIYPTRYSTVWFLNFWLKGELHEDLRQIGHSVNFTLYPPPRPPADVVDQLIVYPSRHPSQRTATDGAGVSVSVQIQSATRDLTNPAIHVANYSLQWVPRPGEDRCPGIVEKYGALKARRDQLDAVMRALPSSAREARARIYHQILDLNGQLAIQQEEARMLNCNLP